MMMICQKAKECEEDCQYKEPHKENEYCKTRCMCEGMDYPKCIKYKEEPVVLFPSEINKESSTTKEEPVIQKLEELADQTAKKDAGKLRYDLIEGSMLPESYTEYPFEYLKPGALTLNSINVAIKECMFIIGSHAKFLEELAKVYSFGCIKYSEKSWQTVPNGRTRYESAVFRHIKDYKNGEWTNWTDGGCLHISQIAWNLIAVKWFITNEK